ncbi:hypothetical protein [Micromonospora sp. NPDC047074]|uniref:hypothetical protein n=1 Tax=Micromonospora sp. NPDC047074 TaxID=3154339 RepID=UPI003400190E
METESGRSRAESTIFREHGQEPGDGQKQLLVGRTLEAGGDATTECFGLAGAGPALAAHVADLARQGLKTGALAPPGARRNRTREISLSRRSHCDMSMGGRGLVVPVDEATDDMAEVLG